MDRVGRPGPQRPRDSDQRPQVKPPRLTCARTYALAETHTLVSKYPEPAAGWSRPDYGRPSAYAAWAQTDRRITKLREASCFVDFRPPRHGGRVRVRSLPDATRYSITPFSPIRIPFPRHFTPLHALCSLSLAVSRFVHQSLFRLFSVDRQVLRLRRGSSCLQRVQVAYSAVCDIGAYAGSRDAIRADSDASVLRSECCNTYCLLFRHKRRMELVELSGRTNGPTRIHVPTGAYAIGGTATLAH
jgi:hypothetical protein